MSFCFRDLPVPKPTVSGLAGLLGPFDLRGWVPCWRRIFDLIWGRPASKDKDPEDAPPEDITVGEQSEGTREEVPAGDHAEVRPPAVTPESPKTPAPPPKDLRALYHTEEEGTEEEDGPRKVVQPEYLRTQHLPRGKRGRGRPVASWAS
ncbi:uncharacterized protein N7479_000721 [Penicillium vulpinum]|uniref:uncharacterized protein n=1 Tax=Penicillium vulpinum TaxID=29845 RepID=UPI00254968C5|nr:uncharacterized protein N7479_000721 [Penicillium vulpinum]KAJ5970803.1 hypothetical protein N7479_000721 [Penicillium vulpinum]